MNNKQSSKQQHAQNTSESSTTFSQNNKANTSSLTKGHIKNIVLPKVQQSSLKQFYPMFSNTFLLVYNNRIIHSTAQGRQLNSINDISIQQILIIGDRQVVMMLFNKNKYICDDYIVNRQLVYWNLQTLKYIIHNYKQKPIKNPKYFNQIKLHYFPQTHLICLIQQIYIQSKQQQIYNRINFWKQQNYNMLSKINLTYYKCIQKYGNFQILLKTSCNIPKKYILSYYKTVKLDQCGKIGLYSSWIKENTLKIIEVDVLEKQGCVVNNIPRFELEYKKQLVGFKVDINYIKFKNIKYNQDWYRLQIADIKEISQNQLYIKLQTKADILKYLQKPSECKITQDLCQLQQTLSLFYNKKTQNFKYLSQYRQANQLQFIDNLKPYNKTRTIYFKSFQQRSKQINPQIQKIIKIQIPILYLDNKQSFKILRHVDQQKRKQNNNFKFSSFPQFMPNVQIKYRVLLRENKIQYVECNFQVLLNFKEDLNLQQYGKIIIRT